MALTGGLLVLYAAWPVLRAPAYAPEGAQFLGVGVAVRDAQFYLSLIRQDVGLSPLLRNPFGEVGQDKVYWGLFWWLCAHVRQLTGWAPATVFNLARYAGTLAAVGAIAALATVTTTRRAERWFAIMLATWGGGFGWLVALTGINDYRSLDLLTPETSTYYLALSFPHLVWALACLAAAFAAAIRCVEQGRAWPWGWTAGTCAFALGFFHPFNLLVLLAAWGLTGAAILFRDRGVFRRWRSAGWPVFALGLVPVLYFAAVLFAYPWGLPETVIRRPAYVELALGFGLLGLGAVCFAIHATQHGAWTRNHLVCAAWVLGTLLLLHSYPLLKQEGRAILGVHLPLGIWTALFVLRVMHHRTITLRFLVAVLVLFAVAPTSLWVMHERLARFELQPGRYFVPAEELRAADVLAARVHAGDRIACSQWSGLMLAGRVPARLFLGKWDQPTAQAHDRVLADLFSPETPPPARRALIERYGITVLWIADVERNTFPEAGLQAAVRDLATDVLLNHGGVVAVRVATPPRSARTRSPLARTILP